MTVFIFVLMACNKVEQSLICGASEIVRAVGLTCHKLESKLASVTIFFYPQVTNKSPGYWRAHDLLPTNDLFWPFSAKVSHEFFAPTCSFQPKCQIRLRSFVLGAKTEDTYSGQLARYRELGVYVFIIALFPK